MKNVKVVEPFRFSGRNGETLKGIIEKNGKAFEIVGNKMFESNCLNAFHLDLTKKN